MKIYTEKESEKKTANKERNELIARSDEQNEKFLRAYA